MRGHRLRPRQSRAVLGRAGPVLLALALVATGCRRNSASEHIQRAKDAIFEKRPEEAVVEYRKAMDALRAEDSPEALVLRARVLKGAADVYRLELRNMKEAAGVYRDLIQQCPESPEALEGRVVLAELLHVHFRDLSGAIDQLTAALARNPPQGATLQYQVAKLYFEQGNYEQSVLEARKVGERYAASAHVDDALFLEGQALHMLEGRRQESMRVYADLLARFPESELAPYALFEQGRLRAEAGEDEQAIELWVQALKSHPHPQTVQDSIARARRRLAATVVPGSREAAFDRVPTRPARNSVEAVGGTAEEAARDHGD